MEGIQKMDPIQQAECTSSRPRKRPRHLLEEGEDAEEYLQDMLEANRSVKLRVLTFRFNHEYFGDFCPNPPSLTAVYRAVRSKNTHKKVAWKNIHKDPEEQLEFLHNISHVPACRIVDIDGMAQSPADFYQKYGWSPKGDECDRSQIQIGTRTFAVHAAFTELGFLTWLPFEVTVGEQEVIEFIKQLAPLLDNDAYGLLDNASNQRTDAVRYELESAFRGMYMYCSPYSPELKPIEHGFSMVKNYIRQRDQEPAWLDDPIGLINAAFKYYSIGEPGGLQAYGLFDLYRYNYEDAINV
jgi:hypothetical protein